MCPDSEALVIFRPLENNPPPPVIFITAPLFLDFNWGDNKALVRMKGGRRKKKGGMALIKTWPRSERSKIDRKDRRNGCGKDSRTSTVSSAADEQRTLLVQEPLVYAHALKNTTLARPVFIHRVFFANQTDASSPSVSAGNRRTPVRGPTALPWFAANNPP